MPSNNFFWFLQKPLDERERTIFYRAYTVSYSFVMVILALLFVVLGFLETAIPSSVIVFAVFLIIMGAHIAGWMALRQEDIGSGAKISRSVIRPAWILLFPLMFGLYIITVIFLFPSNTEQIISLGILGASILHVLLALYTFLLSKSLPLYARILLSFLFPVFTFFFLNSSHFPQRKLRAGVHAVVMNLAYSVAFGIVLLLIRFFLFTPFYSKTDYFDPIIHKDQYLIINKLAKDYSPDDYVVINYNGKILITKIISLHENSVRVETSNGELTVDKNTFIGKVLK